MCLAIPGKIKELPQSKESPVMAKVDFAGIVKEICIDWTPEVKVGDYILAHVGFALNKIDEEEAKETLKLLQEMGELAAAKEELQRGEEE